MVSLTAQNCKCPCGSTVFAATRKPLFRAFCHCSICQEFNQADYADVVVYRRTAVIEPPAGKVEFKTYRPPPNVNRGRCTACGTAAIEVFEAPLLPDLIMVPRAMFSHGAVLPDPVAHIFYDKRQAEHDDGLPKYAGYVRSQWAFAKFLLPSLARSD